MKIKFMNRKEHLEWCKQRALEYVAAGDLNSAFASFQSDMRKHEETANHTSLVTMNQLYFSGQLSTPEKMRDFIEGFN